jgi:hypothetical protein
MSKPPLMPLSMGAGNEVYASLRHFAGGFTKDLPSSALSLVSLVVGGRRTGVNLRWKRW